MSELLQVVESRWPWLTPIVLALLGVQRWRQVRRVASAPAPADHWADPEEALFPSKPGSGLARLISSPARLALKEAGEEALQEEIAGLRADLRRALQDNSRLRAELASRAVSSTRSTAMDGARSQRRRRRRPPLPKSAVFAPPSGAAAGSTGSAPSSPTTTKEPSDE